MDYSTPLCTAGTCGSILLTILLPIYVSFYFHSTDHAFYSKSTDDLLACYWWFYFHSTDHSECLLAGEEISRARNQLTKHVTTSTKASKSSSQWWCRFCWLMAGLANFCWEVCNWELLSFYWWFIKVWFEKVGVGWSDYSHSTEFCKLARYFCGDVWLYMTLLCIHYLTHPTDQWIEWDFIFFIGRMIRRMGVESSVKCE